jgi:hypothetical protein
MVKPRISRTEHIIVAILWVPLGLAMNGLLFWGTWDVVVPRNPLAIALNVFWLAIMVLLFRRARRSADRWSSVEP